MLKAVSFNPLKSQCAFKCHWFQKHQPAPPYIEDHRLELLKPSAVVPTSWRCTYLPQRMDFYKVVAATPARTLVSVFDGVTDYKLGHTMQAKRGAGGWPPLDCCFFAYDSPLKALQAAFPEKSVRRDAPRVLIRVTAEGKMYEHHKEEQGVSQWTGKVALTKLTVRQLMTDAFTRGHAAIPVKMGGGRR